MSDKLKICPFCWGKATVVEYREFYGSRIWELDCDECLCVLRWHFETEEKAIKTWNRRADND